MFKRKGKKTEKLLPPRIRFLTEQDGRIERELKKRLMAPLVAAGVNKAYLAAIDYGHPSTFSVALCLRCSPDTKLVSNVRSVFAALFSADEHLDIIFLNDAQESNLLKICRPFFDSTTVDV